MGDARQQKLSCRDNWNVSHGQTRPHFVTFLLWRLIIFAPILSSMVRKKVKGRLIGAMTTRHFAWEVNIRGEYMRVRRKKKGERK